MIEPHLIVGTVTTGGAGISGITTTSKSVISGRVVAVGVVYRDSPPSTTDVIIRTSNDNGDLPDVTLLTLNNANTNVWVQPFALADDVVGADITGVYTSLAIHDMVEVVVAQANDGDSVDVTILVER